LHQAISKKETSSFKFNPTITAAMVHAAHLNQVGLTKLPFLARLLVKLTSGITAKGSCIDSTTWLSTSSLAVHHLSEKTLA
jgi:hypothetical protein